MDEHSQSGGRTAVSPPHDAPLAASHDDTPPRDAEPQREETDETGNVGIVPQKADGNGTDALTDQGTSADTTAVTTTAEESSEPLVPHAEGAAQGDDSLAVVAEVAEEIPPQAPAVEWEECHVTEARIELRESHALTVVNHLLESMNEGFRHTHFDEDSIDGWMFDAYANHWFVVTYCLNANGRDQVRVRWIDAVAEEAHNDGELPALARYIARSLGGGSNLHLLDSVVRVVKR